MKYLRYFFFAPLFLFCNCGSAGAQTGKDLVFEDHIYEENIRTVLFYRGTDALSYPFLYLGDEVGLTLEFDELIPIGAREGNFWLTVVNCDGNWEASNLINIEYVDGFMTDRITDWQRSQNTLVPYVHFKYEFRPETMRMIRSGNFLLKVYRNADESDLVITRRFIVADRKVVVDANLGQSYATSQRQKLQRINFNVMLNGLQVFNPATDVQVVVLQNGRWDNAASNLQPLFNTQDKLEFQFDAGREFASGNEYRVSDIRSTRFKTRTMQSVEKGEDAYHITLVPEAPRTENTYFGTWDMNGNYFVEVQEYPNGGWEADYVMVKFAMKYPEPLTNGFVYVTGKCFDWAIREENKMVYNASDRQFETEVMLKQGVYNYQFAFRPLKSETLDETKFEGAHYQSENYYTLLVYYTPIGARSPELVGMAHINYKDR